MEGINNADQALIYFRLSSDNQRGYALLTDKDKNLKIFRITGGALGTEIASFSLAGIAGYDPKQFHAFKIHLDRDLIKVSVDQLVDILTVRDSAYYGGEH